MRLPLAATVPPILAPFQLVVSCRFPVSWPLALPPDSLLSCRLLPRCRIEHDLERSPCAYHVPVRFSRLWPPPPPPELHRAQNVPFDQLIWLPSGLRVPLTNCHPGATMPVCPWYCPVDVSPFSFVNVRNAPLSLIEACLVGSPWAHHAPVNAADCGFGGNWAAACFTLNARLMAQAAANKNLMDRLACITGVLLLQGLRSVPGAR